MYSANIPLSAYALEELQEIFPCIKNLFRVDNITINDSIPAEGANAIPDSFDSSIQLTSPVTGEWVQEDDGNGNIYVTGVGTEGLIGADKLVNFGTNDFVILMRTNTTSTAGSFQLGDQVNHPSFSMKHSLPSAFLSTGNTISFASPVGTSLPFRVMAMVVSPSNNSGTFYVVDDLGVLATGAGTPTGDIGLSDWDFSLADSLTILNLFKFKEVYFLQFAKGNPGDSEMKTAMQWMYDNPQGTLPAFWKDKA